jgi:hypothetical protein
MPRNAVYFDMQCLTIFHYKATAFINQNAIGVPVLSYEKITWSTDFTVNKYTDLGSHYNLYKFGGIPEDIYCFRVRQTNQTLPIYHQQFIATLQSTIPVTEENHQLK